jgi:hypothetical protein
VQQELGRLAHRAHEQQQADGGHHVHFPAQEGHGLAGLLRCGSEDGTSNSIEPNTMKVAKMPRSKAEITDAVDDERLDGGGVGARLLVPETDQQVGRQPDAFPAEEHLHQVVGRHQHQHGEGEQRQVR